jgi:hypothetical protein
MNHPSRRILPPNKLELEHTDLHKFEIRLQYFDVLPWSWLTSESQ